MGVRFTPTSCEIGLTVSDNVRKNIFKHKTEIKTISGKTSFWNLSGIKTVSIFRILFANILLCNNHQSF